jgi:hypothetical protein
MKKYKATYKAYYTKPPFHPEVKSFTFNCESDETAEDKARFIISVRLLKNQSGTLLTLSRIE